MTSHAQYYEENLYPLQDKILKTVNSLSSPFYLTGGAALSRGYFNHRYSDNLDFFANGAKDFQSVVSEAVRRIRQLPGITIIPSLTAVFDSYVGFTIKDADGTALKIDFVNDTPYRNGETVMHPVLGRIDSVENILTNKLYALIGRSEINDVADLWQISRKYEFSWKNEIENATQKEACIDTLLISETMRQVSEADFNSIRWIRKPDFTRFQQDLAFIGQDILEEKDNTIPARHRYLMKANTKKA